jgi:phospholipid-transporting ATPase
MTHKCKEFDVANYESATYLFYDAPPVMTLVFAVFGTYVLLLSNFLPLEVVITMQFIKLFVVNFIENDQHMLYEDPHDPRELMYCRVQNLQLHEDLGQVDYLFCDKTGTLTRNELRFRYLSCQGNMLGEHLQFDERFK